MNESKNWEVSQKINDWNTKFNELLTEMCTHDRHSVLRVLYSLHMHIHLLSESYTDKARFEDGRSLEREVFTGGAGAEFQAIDRMIDEAVATGVPGEIMVASLILFKSKTIALIGALGDQLGKMSGMEH